MAVRPVVLAVLASAALFAGVGCNSIETPTQVATEGPADPAQSPSAISLDHAEGCGVVTYPDSGATGTVVVSSGGVPCAEAMQILDRYLHDPSLQHAGNTWSAEFDGWVCASPTATAAQVYGYSTSCTNNSGSEIQVRPQSGAAAEPLSSNCDPSAISADLGQQLNVVRCYEGWAYVDSGELGDAQSLVRSVGGSWTRYTGFPSSICRGKAALQGVPLPELRSFSPC